MPDTLNPASVARGVQHRRGCELHEKAMHGVPGRRPRNAAVMVVGEQPGDVEDEEGDPSSVRPGAAVFGSSFRVGTQRGRSLTWPEQDPVPR